MTWDSSFWRAKQKSYTFQKMWKKFYYNHYLTASVKIREPLQKFTYLVCSHLSVEAMIL